MIGRLHIAASVLLLAACGSNPSQSGSSRTSNIITAEDIAGISAATATDIIRRLRPNWLRTRGPVSISSGGPEVPIIYIDEVRSSDPGALDRIPRQIITEIRFLAGRDASTLYGMDHGGGAIMVRTRR
jgi:hypothetical protein